MMYKTLILNLFLLPLCVFGLGDKTIKVTNDYYEIDGQYYVDVEDISKVLRAEKSINVVIDYLSKTERSIALIEELKRLEIEFRVESADLFPAQGRQKAQGY